MRIVEMGDIATCWAQGCNEEDKDVRHPHEKSVILKAVNEKDIKNMKEFAFFQDTDLMIIKQEQFDKLKTQLAESQKQLEELRNELRKYFKVRDKWGRDDYTPKRRNDTIYACMLIRHRRLKKLLEKI